MQLGIRQERRPLLVDINHKIWNEKVLKVCANLVVVVMLISVATTYGFKEYNSYVEATTVPKAPSISLEKDGANATLTVNSNESRNNHENIVYISEDGKTYNELLVSEEDVITLDKLTPEVTYYFKVKVRVYYEGEAIDSYASEEVNVMLDAPKPVVEYTGTVSKKEEIEEEAEAGTSVTISPAVANSTEAWAGEVERQLIAHGVYTDERKATILNIIHHESTGREHAVGGGGEYVGLVQFGSHWKHDYPESYWAEHGLTGPYQADNRYSGSWSIHKIVEVYVEGGDAAVQRHWAATYSK